MRRGSRHLWDPSYRETYESAHSVMLAVFAAHAKGNATPQTGSADPHPRFVERLVPMYAQCLVEVCLSTRSQFVFMYVDVHLPRILQTAG